MLTSYKNILYATDLSANSTKAFRHAVALSKQGGADIHILHAVEELSDDARTTLMMFVLDEKQRDEAINNRTNAARKALDEMQDKFWSTMPDEDKSLREHIKSVEVVEAYPAEAILNHAQKLGCDLIVLGAHAQGFSHTFLGSIPKRVLRRSQVPTLIVPASS